MHRCEGFIVTNFANNPRKALMLITGLSLYFVSPKVKDTSTSYDIDFFFIKHYKVVERRRITNLQKHMQ